MIKVSLAIIRLNKISRKSLVNQSRRVQAKYSKKYFPENFIFSELFSFFSVQPDKPVKVTADSAIVMDVFRAEVIWSA